MSNDPRENLHGSDGQELADVTAAAEQAGEQAAMHMTTSQTPAQSMADALAEDGALDPQETLVSDAPTLPNSTAEATPASFTTNAPQQAAQELTPTNSTNSANSAATNTNTTHNDTGNEVALAAPVHLPPAKPRPWYRSRRSFCAKGRGGRVQVAGLSLTYTDHVTGAALLAGIDLGFRARSLSAILDPTGRRARALFLILAGLEEPQAGRIVAAPSRSLAARLAGRIGSVALIHADSPLDESLTIRQNILAPLSATGSVADWDNLVGALQITGLAQRVELYPSELSEWERFKALIARAIVSGAEVFLVEDPITLPPAARTELGPLLRALADAGCAVVLATPNPEVAAASDRAILLTNGRVALDAPGPSVALINASLEANPEDPKALLGPIPSALPSSFDEVISPTGSSSAPAWHPLGTDEAGAQSANAQQASAPEEAPTRPSCSPDAPTPPRLPSTRRPRAWQQRPPKRPRQARQRRCPRPRPSHAPRPRCEAFPSSTPRTRPWPSPRSPTWSCAPARSSPICPVQSPRRSNGPVTASRPPS